VRRLAEALTPAARSGDYAQAMMDLGATVCTPRNPACVICPWREPCAGRRRGPESFPRRAPKRAAKLRTGAAFWVTRADRFVLVRTRPASGLLGGMTEVPTSAWADGFDAGPPALAGAPLRANWRRLPGTVTHTFTHFPLELVVYAAEVPRSTPAPAGARWQALDDLADEAFPSLMRKVIAHALRPVVNGE